MREVVAIDPRLSELQGEVFFDVLNRSLRFYVVNCLPAALHSVGDIFRSVIDVEERFPAASGHFLDDFVEAGVRFHRTVFV